MATDDPPIRVIVLAADEDDALRFVLRGKPGGHLTLIWPGCLEKLNRLGFFDRLLVTQMFRLHPSADATEAAVKTRITKVPL